MCESRLQHPGCSSRCLGPGPRCLYHSSINDTEHLGSEHRRGRVVTIALDEELKIQMGWGQGELARKLPLARQVSSLSKAGALVMDTYLAAGKPSQPLKQKLCW